MVKKQREKSSVIYSNFSPYENTGNILDYLLTNYENVWLFSFNFHVLKNKKEVNFLKIFKNGKLMKTFGLFMFPIPESLIFFLLPVRSLVILIEIALLVLIHRRSLTGKIIFFTVNAYIAWIGTILKRLGIVHRTIFWVWDYYPPQHENKIVVFMRWLYWHFDKAASARSDKVVFLNNRLLQLRKDINVIDKSKKYEIIPIGTNPIRHTRSSYYSKREIKLAFIGVVKKSQGLDFIFDSAKEFKSKGIDIQFEIIGDGPDLEYFKNLSRNSSIICKFHGILSEDDKLESKKIIRILKTCDIGIATYKPEKSNVSYYGDPSKIKKYLSVGIPVITTNVFHFWKELQNSKAGMVITYGNSRQFAHAAISIMSQYKKYLYSVSQIARKYEYNKIYKVMFS